MQKSKRYIRLPFIFLRYIRRRNISSSGASPLGDIGISRSEPIESPIPLLSVCYSVWETDCCTSGRNRWYGINWVELWGCTVLVRCAYWRGFSGLSPIAFAAYSLPKREPLSTTLVLWSMKATPYSRPAAFFRHTTPMPLWNKLYWSCSKVADPVNERLMAFLSEVPSLFFRYSLWMRYTFSLTLRYLQITSALLPEMDSQPCCRRYLLPNIRYHYKSFHSANLSLLRLQYWTSWVPLYTHWK